MTTSPATRLAYDDGATPAELGADARRCGIRLRRAAPRRPADLLVPDVPGKPSGEIAVSLAAQRLANALHLHLD